MKEQIDIFDDLLIEFDEMGFVPTNFLPDHDSEYYAIDWRNRLINALEGYRKQSEWISVEDRLPQSQVMVIGYTPCDGYMFVGFLQKVDSRYGKPYWNVITAMRSTRKMTKKVTHWMPLPEPPEMKGGAE